MQQRPRTAKSLAVNLFILRSKKLPLAIVRLHPAMKDITRSKRQVRQGKSRLTTCLCFLGLLLTAILSMALIITHVGYERGEKSGKQFLRMLEPKQLQSAVSEVFDSLYHSQGGHSRTPVPEPAIVHTPIPTSVNAVSRPPEVSTSVNLLSLRQSSLNKAEEMHFIHIPKCGGTTMTTVLRQLQCQRDPIQNEDCCTNPGFCDWHAKRRCSTIKGCINHFPNLKFLGKAKSPSITVFREPISRLLSAWFYRGHSPNLDFFQVRPYFKEIADGKRPRVEFDEYIEMVEYQNIQTRMLGADSFPYRNISITEEVFQRAADTIGRFVFIGLQEEFEVSTRLITRLMQLDEAGIKVVKEREQQGMKQIKQKKELLTSNSTLMSRVREVNDYDVRLYKLAVQHFCQTLSFFPDLAEKVRERGRVRCE